jgi:hypothetical protein
VEYAGFLPEEKRSFLFCKPVAQYNRILPLCPAAS